MNNYVNRLSVVKTSVRVAYNFMLRREPVSAESD